MKFIKNLIVKSVLIAVTTFLIFAGIGVASSLINRQDEIVVLEIPRGHSPSQIANLLKDNDLIDSKVYFRAILKYSPEVANLQAGVYEFDKSDTTISIITKISEGRVAQYEDIRITIPEGRTIEEMGLIFERNNLFTANEFYEAVNTIELDYEWFAGIDNANILYKLEGYLFPDTYDFRTVTTPVIVIKRLAARFDQQIFQLFKSSGFSKDMSFHQLLTLASIVEKEAVIDDERPIIASVFYNRLDINQALQSCATVQYILEEHKEVLSIADTQIETPYNTYKYSGLPPGPVSSVGLASFKAVLDPADTNYRYFNAIGNGRHNFSVTFAQHEDSIRQNR